jgi:hypothetical protein
MGKTRLSDGKNSEVFHRNKAGELRNKAGEL